jgi:hypothetical protein
VQGLFGYVPGIGQVQMDGALRILAADDPLERQGITLFVERGAADSQRTVLVYRVEGLSIAAANSQGEAVPTGGVAALLLPDGSLLAFTGGEGSGWGTGYRTRLTFPALPGGVTDATLLISRLESMPAGVAPEDWRIPLHFQPAPADLKVMPVYELATRQPTVAAAQPGAATPAPTGSPAAQAGSPQFSLDTVLELENGFQLQGYITWDGSSSTSGWVSNPILKDATGQVIPSESTTPEAAGASVGGAHQHQGRPRPLAGNLPFPDHEPVRRCYFPD